MPIRYLAGDLFAPTHPVQALAHGCNCQGAMGAGIALTFRRRYPAMYDGYRAMCLAQPRTFNLGDAWLWRDEHLPWVFNLGTQEGYWRDRAKYDAIETSLRSMRTQADALGIRSIALPRIGAGLGGLSWKKVCGIIDAVYADWSEDLDVYETFVAASQEA